MVVKLHPLQKFLVVKIPKNLFFGTFLTIFWVITDSKCISVRFFSRNIMYFDPPNIFVLPCQLRKINGKGWKPHLKISKCRFFWVFRRNTDAWIVQLSPGEVNLRSSDCDDILVTIERSEIVYIRCSDLTGGQIQNAIWPKIRMLLFILGQNKSKQAKKKISTRPGPTRPGLTLIKQLLLGRYRTEVAEILQVCSPT